jgi:small conductance mechanosensitive channel
VDILIILAEVSLLIFLGLLLNWLLGKSFQQLMKVALLKKGERSATVLRRNIRGILVLLVVVLSLAIVVTNGWLIYKGENLQEYTIKLIRGIPLDFWSALAMGIMKSLGVLALVSFSLRFLRHWLDLARDRAEEFEQLTANDESEDDPLVLEPTQVDGLEEFGDYRLLIRTITKVKPGGHSRIRRVFRKRLKEAFDKEGIEIPLVES